MRSYAVLMLLAAGCWLHAQTPNPSAATPSTYPVPTVTLSFGSPQPTPLGKKGSVMLGNSTCAPDGTLFMEMADSPWNSDFVLQSLTNETENVRYAASMVPGYEDVSWPEHYFASDNAVVALVWARPRATLSEQDQGVHPQGVQVALIYDRKGTLKRAVPIPQNIDPKSIGMYRSGDLLVITKDASTNRLRLLVLDHDGDIKNELSLFDYDYDAAQQAKKKQPLSKAVDAADFIQIIPHGDDLLLVPQLTTATVIEVNEQGIVRTTDLQLPHGYLLRSLFPGDGPYWTVSTYDHAKVLHDKASGNSNAAFLFGPIFQFNSFDGSLVRKINMPAPAKGHYANSLCAPIPFGPIVPQVCPAKHLDANILCAHNGDFIAVTTDKETGRLEILIGSIPR